MNQLLAMRVFVRVVETGSFSQAAGQLMLPRSTVSKLVTDLEKHLRISLIQRTTRTVSITSEGLEYYHHAQRLISELDEIDSALSGRKLRPSGHLRIDVPVSFANGMLIPALPDFHREYPEITIALGISDRTINIVSEGVDCAIRAGALQDMTMIARKIADLDFVLCASRDYLVRHGMPQSPTDIARHHTCVGYFYASSGKPEMLVLEKDGQRFEFDNSHFCTNEGTGLTSLMLAGLGIGQHLRRVVQPWLDSGELVEILPQWSRPTIPLHAVYSSNRHQSARLKVFIDWIITTFGQPS